MGVNELWTKPDQVWFIFGSIDIRAILSILVGDTVL